MSQLAFYFNSDKCISCRSCASACKEVKNLQPGRKLRKVYTCMTGGWSMKDGIYEPDSIFGYSLSLACNHCAEPACVEFCTTGAMGKDTATGIVSNDKSICIGCGTCADACPYGAPSTDKKAGTTDKCDMCKDLLANGEKPACVASCMMRCLDIGEYSELVAKYGSVNNIQPLPDSSMTRPSLVITPNRRYRESAKMVITNMQEELQAVPSVDL